MELQLDHSPVIHTFPCTDILIGLCPCKGKKKPKQTYTWEFFHRGSGSIRIINAVSILVITLNKKKYLQVYGIYKNDREGLFIEPDSDK